MANLEEMLMKPYPCSLGDSLFDFKVPLCLKQVPRALGMHGSGLSWDTLHPSFTPT